MAVLLGVAIAAAAGSSGVAAATATTQGGATGPSAEFSRALAGGNGVFIGSPIAVNLKRFGYLQREYAASGTATSYRSAAPLTGDGRWSFEPDAQAPYRTRVLVRRPADPARFSGTVVVEWLNVSGGVDADPEWATLHEEMLRRGDAWVGVSAQQIGVMGGPVLVRVDVPGAETAGKGIKTIDPKRYGSLDHPGDGFAFDIYTQVARAVRSGTRMGGLRVKRVIAGGESQSAFALVTYYNGVQPLTRAFDGFFVHSRGAVGLPLVGPGRYADIAGSITGTATTFRDDQDAPVMDVQSESDVTSVLSSYRARQPDTDRFRLWEVAGTAHADAHLIGSSGAAIDCGVPINNGPLHLVAKAGYHALTAWMEKGSAPPTAPRLDVTADMPPQLARDANGIALGGIRTPPVDVPVATLSGTPGPNPSTICLLLGSTAPFSDAQLRQLYPSRARYRDKYRADTEKAIKSGFVLAKDRAALLAFAEPTHIPG
ncbi:MAG TPA: alpha/beta hydrolase domain-containing protein [Acidimicrobiia bacterium]|nr:alpha/beta hydrolase domain-containing protein [Acidimicrobiia bacterium]